MVFYPARLDHFDHYKLNWGVAVVLGEETKGLGGTLGGKGMAIKVFKEDPCDFSSVGRASD
jgi:hypothetical protein